MSAGAQELAGCRGVTCPTTYRSHFEPNPGAYPDSGSRDGWESYPTTQETGYEPSIFPLTEKGESRLVREAAPTKDGEFSLGFIRRVQLVAGQHASFHAWVRAPFANRSTHVTLTVFHGREEERHDATLAENMWTSIDVALKSSEAPVTAIALTEDLPEAHVGRLERIEMKDVRVEAMGTRHLKVREPAALWDGSRELYYAQRSLTPGETLHVALQSSEPGLRWTLSAPGERVIARGDGAEVSHLISANEPVGMWILHAMSAHSDTEVLVLVRPQSPRALVFDAAPKISAEMLASVRRRRDELRAKTHVEEGANIAAMDPHWLLAGLPSYFNLLLQPSELALMDAIDYRESGDARSLEESRRLLQAMAAWPLWVHPWFPAHGYHSYYPVGLMTRSVVMAMEFLGPDLGMGERRELESALRRQAVVPIYEEYVLEDRLQFNTSNWIGNTVSAALLAALESRDPELGCYTLGLAMKERDHVRAAYTPDGSYGEGVTYHRFDLETTAPAAAAMKRLLGVPVDEELLRSSDSYLRHTVYNNEGNVLDYGDSHVDAGPSNVFAYVAAMNRSESLARYYFRFRDTGTAELLPRVLWEGDIQKPGDAAETEPASKVFETRGIAVLRSGWNDDANVIAMRAGENFNHNHADEGSLFYARGGTLWLGEAGYADYYKDPSYNSYNIQALGHNVLLVDDDAESQALAGDAVAGASPKIEHAVLGGTAALLQADLTSVYRGKLERYTRTLLWKRDGTLVVLDDVASAEPHRFTQVWHPLQSIVETSLADGRFVLAHDAERLTMQAAASTALETRRGEAPMPLTSYELAETKVVSRPQLLFFSTREATKTAYLASVIQPGERDGPAPTMKVTSEGVELAFDDGSVAQHRKSGEVTVVARWKGGVAALDVSTWSEGLLGGSLRADGPVDLLSELSPSNLSVLTLHSDRGVLAHLDGVRASCRSGCTIDGGGIHVGAGTAVLDLTPMVPR
ncbi:Heparinase II/III-like protein [Bryocella elongata]|uniref:Heparinase II/III-like protein n=1 Tax=Bryocella elongata TaxID=863522 RepID=A0A1H6C364_9BACT|nr:heparinase II/III family protein [Bryocella elongata]SEG67388.1 Heparinase II/III-like protein [Bryocella elongata]